MALLGKALFTWFLVLLFMILVAYRLDKAVSWSWFLVFIPLWIQDVFTIIHLSIIIFCNDVSESCSTYLTRHVGYIMGVLLKTVGQVLVCYKLDQSQPQCSTFFTLLPWWILLVMITGDVTVTVVKDAAIQSGFDEDCLS